MNLSLIFVKFIHLLIILFVILVPFIGNNFLLVLHAIIIPFIMLHWVINNNICFLTVVEQYLSKDKNYKGIIAQIIEPIYDFKKNNESFSKIIYIITFILWLITINRIFNGYSSINKQIEGDLFTFEKFGLFLVS